MAINSLITATKSGGSRMPVLAGGRGMDVARLPHIFKLDYT